MEMTSSKKASLWGFGIIGLVIAAWIALSSDSMIDYSRSPTRAKLRRLETALNFYKLDIGDYPSTTMGLHTLKAPSGSDARPPNFREAGYLENESDLVDPWGSEFQYRYPGSRNSGSYDLWSNGRDGRPGGTGEDRDISNWD
jgi:general secretion pathway protein G